ncbi:MAG TPA: adenylate/guanylate cyclase domain-containing protein [Solirubrobacteraceae bacterium]|jgi:adenylate cyclase|nr:adenylate/guanylate cyclase domain-containing protein [Solirubrobacteraceae bacterium]
MRGRLRTVATFATAAALVAVAVAGYGFGALKTLELSSIDKRFDIRGPQTQPKDVVVVAIDHRTFDRSDLQWPFPRHVHAEVIDALRRAGARVIAFDVQFTAPSTTSEDNALIEAIGRAGNVVLATDAADRHGRTTVLGGEDTLRAIHASAGNSLLPNDADQRIRRMYYEQSHLRTMAVVAVQRATGRPVPRSDFPDDRAWIDFAGPPGTVRTVSYWAVREGEVPASAFRGKIVIVGATEPTLHDSHFTSTSGATPMPGVEIQANAIETILRGFPLTALGRIGNLLLIVALGLIPPLAGLWLRPLRAMLASIAAGLAFAVLAQVAFDRGLIVAFTYPLLALVLSAIGTLAVGFVAEAFERARVRDVFSRFVSEAVVDEVLEASGGGVRLGGVRRRCTVMFSDLRGFTSFAETLEPEVVVSILNRYLTAMSDAILDHGGTLVAYMGDGIFAVFGAPVPGDDHADRAFAAARDMFGALGRFNEWLRSEGHGHAFRMGVGLNTGPVMSGHVGSERRLEYAAIGDTTNTAARLEAMTKGTPYRLFMSETTRALLSEPADDLVFVDELEVRGRRTTVRVWGLPEDDAGPDGHGGAPLEEAAR